MSWYLLVLSKYAVFSGRARRQEYWMFFLFNLIFTIALGFVDRMFGTDVLSFVYGVFIFIPNLAVLVRRLHDTGRSGWWALLLLVPLIGILVLFIFAILDGHTNENEYGQNPKHIAPRY
ncbi:DUF805 domain-containing protein [Vibrio sp. RC27]